MNTENGKEITLVIDGEPVDFVRKDSVNATPLEIGEKRIIVADRGWIFVGACADNADGSVTITNARNIRRWGTSKGLGELQNGPLQNTVADTYGTVRVTPIVQIAVIGGW